MNEPESLAVSASEKAFGCGSLVIAQVPVYILKVLLGRTVDLSIGTIECSVIWNSLCKDANLLEKFVFRL